MTAQRTALVHLARFALRALVYMALYLLDITTQGSVD